MIHATCIGNLGADPELKFGSSGTAYLKLRVAASFKDKEGEKTTWVGGTIFNKRAEALAKVLAKGDKVGLRGTLYTREYNGKTYVEMTVDEIELLGGKRQDGQRPAASNGADTRPAATVAASADDLDASFGGDDLPDFP